MRTAVAFLAIWLIAGYTASGNLQEHVRTERENSKDKDLALRCLWHCNCYRKENKGRTHVVVVCSNMSEFPMITPKGTTNLQLIDNDIGDITDTSLQHESLMSLEIFECTNSRITTIHTNAFRNLRKLKTVDLKDNLIVRLTAVHFIDQKHLDALILTGNQGLNCGPLKELQERRENPVRVFCDDVQSTSTKPITKPQTENVNPSSVKTDERDKTSTTKGEKARTEGVADVTKPTLLPNKDHSEDTTQGDSKKSSVEPEGEMKLIIVGSIVGAVIALILGVTSVLTRWYDKKQGCK